MLTALVLLLAAVAAQADPLCNAPGVLAPIPSSSRVLTVSSVACTLVTCAGGAAIPAYAYAALVSVETASIRYRDDTSSPTSANGQLVGSGQSIAVCGPTALASLSMIRTTATDATAQVSFYVRQN